MADQPEPRARRLSDDAIEVLPQNDHDLLVQLAERVSQVSARMGELVKWKHDELPPIILEVQKDIINLVRSEAALRSEVSAVCASVDKLAAVVTQLMVVPATLEKHEAACIQARKEDIVHRDRFETRVDELFDASAARREALHSKIEAMRNWVVGGVISTLLTLLTAAVSILWPFIQKGWLSVFYP